MGDLRQSLFSGARPGYYGEFGGAFYPEILHSVLRELSEAFDALRDDPRFWDRLHAELSSFSSRPTPLTALQHLGLRYWSSGLPEARRSQSYRSPQN